MPSESKVSPKPQRTFPEPQGFGERGAFAMQGNWNNVAMTPSVSKGKVRKVSNDGNGEYSYPPGQEHPTGVSRL